MKIPDHISLPRDLSRYETDYGILYVAPELCASVVVDADGDVFMQKMRSGIDCKEALTAVVADSVCPSKEVFESLIRLIGQLQLEQFSQHTQPCKRSFEHIKKGLHLYLTRNCNLMCCHCYMGAGPWQSENMPLKLLQAVVSRLKPLLHGVNFSGGEPLLHPCFWDFADYIVREQKLPASLYTNGTRINTLQIAKKISSAFEEVQVSLDGASEATNDAIRGKGAFKKSCRALSLLSNVGIKELAVAICLFPATIDSLLVNLVPLLDGIDPQKHIKSVRFSSLEPFGRAQALDRSIFNSDMDSKVSELKTKIIDSGRRLWDHLDEEQRSEYYRFDKPAIRYLDLTCGLGNALAVDTNGDLYTCAIPHPDLKLGNFSELEVDLPCLWENSFVANSVDQVMPCAECDIRYFCKGGCRLRNIPLGLSPSRPVCDEKKKMEMVRAVARNSLYRFSALQGRWREGGQSNS